MAYGRYLDVLSKPRRKRRIPWGKESWQYPDLMLPKCPKCGAMFGKLHKGGCIWEECPHCKLPLYNCGHAGVVIKSKGRKKKKKG